MIKKNPNCFLGDSLKILNNFKDFVIKMQVFATESSQFKKDVIKVIESLKFIKTNLEFIGYAVENKTDSSLYTHETDMAKGVIRDFNNTSLHLNAYHNKEDIQTAFANLIAQFENAISMMQKDGKLEIFARQLQYDKNVGCIEGRISKALLFAAASMSSSSHLLDQLMAQCQFLPDDDTTALLSKAKAFFEPYIGQICIWENKNYLLDISLIKRYLIEVFAVEFPNEEVERIQNLLGNFSLAEKIKWLNSSLPLSSFEVCTLLLEEIDKINKGKNFTFKQQLTLFKEAYCVNLNKFFDSYPALFFLIQATLGIGLITLGLIFQPWLVAGLTIAFFVGFVIGLCRFNERYTKFEILFGWLVICTLPLSIANFLTTLTISAIFNVIITSIVCLAGKPLQLFVSNQNLLLTQCINNYFEGKTDLPSENIIQLLKQFLQNKSELTRKEVEFLNIIETGEKNIHYPDNAVEIWQQGVRSWLHYRFLRKSDDIEINSVLDELLVDNQLFQGSTCSFDWNLQKHEIERYNFTFEKVNEVVFSSQALAKVVKPRDWQLFVKQLANVKYRATLRKPVSHPTHKFVHLTGEIVSYNKDIVKKNQKNFTHTKKTSLTLLSSGLHTTLFGAHHGNALNLVGFLFDQKKCKVKARFLQDSGTYQHSWVGNEIEVKNYQAWVKNRIAIDENFFIDKIQNTDQTNEVLAQVNKEALMAIVIGKGTSEALHLAISRQIEIKEKFSIRLPIIFYDASQKSIKLYERQDILAGKLLQQKKQNVIKLNSAFLERNWKPRFFCTNSISGRRVSATAVFLNSKVQQLLEDPIKAYDYYSWALAEQEIKEMLDRKCKQNKFFRIFNGRKQETLEFYQNILKTFDLHSESRSPR